MSDAEILDLLFSFWDPAFPTTGCISTSSLVFGTLPSSCLGFIFIFYLAPFSTNRSALKVRQVACGSWASYGSKMRLTASHPRTIRYDQQGGFADAGSLGWVPPPSCEWCGMSLVGKCRSLAPKVRRTDRIQMKSEASWPRKNLALALQCLDFSRMFASQECFFPGLESTLHWDKKSTVLVMRSCAFYFLKKYLKDLRNIHIYYVLWTSKESLRHKAGSLSLGFVIWCSFHWIQWNLPIADLALNCVHTHLSICVSACVRGCEHMHTLMCIYVNRNILRKTRCLQDF